MEKKLESLPEEIENTPSLNKDPRRDGYPFTVDEFKVITGRMRDYYFNHRLEGIWLRKLKQWN